MAPLGRRRTLTFRQGRCGVPAGNVACRGCRHGGTESSSSICHAGVVWNADEQVRMRQLSEVFDSVTGEWVGRDNTWLMADTQIGQVQARRAEANGGSELATLRGR